MGRGTKRSAGELDMMSNLFEWITQNRLQMVDFYRRPILQTVAEVLKVSAKAVGRANKARRQSLSEVDPAAAAVPPPGFKKRRTKLGTRTLEERAALVVPTGEAEARRRV